MPTRNRRESADRGRGIESMFRPTPVSRLGPSTWPGPNLHPSSMHIAIVTFDGFNEIDSFVALNILNRMRARGWRAEIVCPSETVVSGNGVQVTAQRPLEAANDADVVLIGSGRLTPKFAADPATMTRLRLDPRRQLIGCQCSGALVLAGLGLLSGMPVCTDLQTRPLVQAQGIHVLGQSFFARGN